MENRTRHEILGELRQAYDDLARSRLDNGGGYNMPAKETQAAQDLVARIQELESQYLSTPDTSA